MSDLLQQIQQMQFAERSAAEALLLGFLRDIYSQNVAAVELRPLAVSLNSFNGFLTLTDGKRLFFKTHTEPDGVIGEYYNAAQLAQAGYPVIQPVFSSTESGKQLLIYEVIESPSVFDVAWQIERGDSQHLDGLTEAQHHADEQLLELYRATLQPQPSASAAAAPIHQLFYHRLMRGRLQRFYGDRSATLALPAGTHSLGDIRNAHWCINGQYYDQTIDQLIVSATELLHPAQDGPSILGHGDAHNGNVFYREDERSLLYFDPAFAGRHHPLLDLTKPLFHNVFAMWMYFAQVKSAELTITIRKERDLWVVEHDYALHPVREMFLTSKVERTLIPILLDLQKRGQLRADWRAYLKAALFCCPFLTMNLADAGKFPPAISLLGLAMSVEMGAESHGRRSRVDQMLDEVAVVIRS
jgi:hypothetical protein